MNPYVELAKMGIGGSLGAVSAYLSPDQQAAYSNYANTLNQLSQTYDPYVNIGEKGLKGFAGMSALNVLAPTASENRMAATFTNSPYQNQIMQNTTNQMNANAAMQGTLNSTAQQAALQNALAGQQNQWQQQYINRGENEYNRGIQGMYNLAGLGFQGLGAQSRLGQEAALGQLKGDLSPSKESQMFSGITGGALGML